jgi:hypothetical protein
VTDYKTSLRLNLFFREANIKIDLNPKTVSFISYAMPSL